jgi:hypothetical protein
MWKRGSGEGPAFPPRTLRWCGQITLAVAGVVAAASWIACSDPLGPEQDELGKARARWEAHGVQFYGFTFQRGCFCPPAITRPVRIEVWDGVVVSAVDPDTGDPLDPPQEGFPTIDDLFDEIQEAIDREADEIQASYDEDFGYPVNVFVDWITNAIDDEMSFQVTDYTEALAAQAQLSHPAHRGAGSSK